MIIKSEVGRSVQQLSQLGQLDQPTLNARISPGVQLWTPAGFGAHRHPDRLDWIAGAVATAILLLLGCLWRHEAAGSTR